MAIVLPDTLPDVRLSTIRPDYVSIRDQLNMVLQTSAVWRDIIPASTGEILIKFVAGVGAYSQYAIERYVQECFFDTAKSPQNILTLARTLGVRIARKSPAKVTVQIERDSVLAAEGIPQYSDFTIGGTHFYNAEAATFAVGVASIEIELTEGTAVDSVFTSSGEPWQKFYVGSGFRSSDELIRVRVAGVEWEKLRTGIWYADPLYTGEPALQFSDQTTAAGRAEIQFGNGIVGSIPPPGSEIRITEYVVAGSATNNSESGLRGTALHNSDWRVTTTTPIVSADDEPAAALYTQVGARAARSLDRYVSRSDYESNLIFYPNVVDVRVVGEHEVGTDLNMMNVVNIYTLLSDAFEGEDEQNRFLDHIYEKSVIGVVNRVIYAQPLDLDIVGQLLVSPKASLSDVYARVVAALSAKLAPQSGSIGRSVYRSDLHQTVMNVPGVVHFVMSAPTTDAVPAPDEWVRLNGLTITPSYYER